MKKFILSLLSIFCSLILLSSPAHAVELTIESTPTGNFYDVNSVRCLWAIGQNVVVYNYNTPTCIRRSGGDATGRQLVNISHEITNVRQDYYYKAFVSVQWAYAGDKPVGNTVLFYPATTSQWTLIKFQAISEGYQNYDGDTYTNDTQMYYSVIYEVVLRANEDLASTWFNVGNGANTLFYNPSKLDYQNVNISLGRIEEYERVPLTVEAIENQTQVIEEQSELIRSGNEEAQDRWESDKEEESQREQDLTDQSDDVSISAQNPGNPFASLFTTQDCQSLPTISSWFNMDSPMQVCSPYPAQIKPVIQFVSSALVIGLLIRLYFKLFKGGYAS